MFTFFATMESTKPQPRDWTWEQFVENVMNGHKVIPVAQKEYVWHFNACTYKTGSTRKRENIETVNALVLDFDDNMEFTKALGAYHAFQKLEFVAFTSFNHQHAKSESDRPRDKFRIVIPFTKPCPLAVYEEITSHLRDKIAYGVADPCVTNPNQIFTYVYCPDETKELASVRHVSQEYPNASVTYLDSETMPRVAKESYLAGSDGQQFSKADHYLPADHIFKTSQGDIRFRDVSKRISKVYCPHHADKSPGSFLNKAGKTIYHHCNKCGTTKLSGKVILQTMKKCSSRGVSNTFR